MPLDFVAVRDLVAEDAEVALVERERPRLVTAEAMRLRGVVEQGRVRLELERLLVLVGRF